MYRRTYTPLWVLLFVLLMGLVVACTPGENGVGNAAATPEPTTTSDEPAFITDDPATKFLDDVYVTGEAMIDTVDLLIMESFPLQMMAHITGNYPDGCTSLGEVKQERIDNVITLTIATVRPVDMMCTQALVPFEENIPVDIYGLPAGEYTVNVNGVTATFTLDMDNILPE